MLISLAFLNRLLSPGGLSADDVERALLRMGFPIEERTDLPGGDVRLDVEVTSNRGDCLSHLGLAREVAAGAGQRVAMPEIPPHIVEGRGAGADGGEPVERVSGVDNRVTDVCPRFTARVITGVKVGPSPKWLVEALEAVGQRSINNVVDASNYVLLEMGNPSHAFDLNTLAERRLVVRRAGRGERLTTLEDQKIDLREEDLVVADAERPVSLAGVIGGLETGVTEKTTDLLLEVATWDPPTIRRTARLVRIDTDASKRFERIVDPRTLDLASTRLAALVLELAGGALLPGVIDEGAARPEGGPVRLRAGRCRALLGEKIASERMVDLLSPLGVEATLDADADALDCVIPPERAHDLRREVDLIEEVGRAHGYENVEIDQSLAVRVAHPQETERALREVSTTLAGMGFYETVTFSFVTEEHARLFAPGDAELVKVDEERRRGAPYLRPSVLPSLLEVRRVNQDAGARTEGGVRLFEIGPCFLQENGVVRDGGLRVLSLLMDAPDAQLALRTMRGVIESVVRTLGGLDVPVDVRPSRALTKADHPEATATLRIGAERAGTIRLLTQAALQSFGLDAPVVAAEIELDPLLAMYPPASHVEPPPAFPAIERDLSIVVDEGLAWAKIESAVQRSAVEQLAGVRFIGSFRGKQVGAGRKSVTLRLRFQNPERTLRHDEVDPQVSTIVRRLRQEAGAELRG